MKYITTLLLLFVASSHIEAAEKSADICGDRTIEDGTVFSLSIDRSFDPEVGFSLCERKDPKDNFLLVAVGPPNESEIVSQRQILLDKGVFDKLVALYEKALEYDVKDDAWGLDGSLWCLETQRGFTYSKACFWSPKYQPENRGLIGMVNLGEELWRVAELKNIGRLY